MGFFGLKNTAFYSRILHLSVGLSGGLSKIKTFSVLEKTVIKEMGELVGKLNYVAV